MTYYVKTMFSMLVFMIFVSWLVGEITGIAYILLNPITWIIITLEMAAVVVAPTGVLIAGNTVRTIAMGVLFGTMFITFFVDLLYNSMPIVWGILIVPIYITLGFMLIEAGK